MHMENNVTKKMTSSPRIHATAYNGYLLSFGKKQQQSFEISHE